MTLPRPEYPRPQFRRCDWTNLNGPWCFAFDDVDLGLDRAWHHLPAERLDAPGSPFDRRILVPFCHQAHLSGIGETGFHDVVWYGRAFVAPPLPPDGRLLLHFGAVDYRATVWVNGEQVAAHEGGHTPFRADVTRALCPGGARNALVVRVEDPGSDKTVPRGKQTWKHSPEHIFYTRTTGIWQTVWLEPVGQRRLDAVRLTADLEGGAVDIEATVLGATSGARLRAAAAFAGRPVATAEVEGRLGCTPFRLSLRAPRTGDVAAWSPEAPNLYDLRFELLGDDGTLLDAVDSYAGLRSIKTRGDEVCLNGRPYYQRLVLDQGYFPDGLLTAPTDAHLRRDIELAKQMGFNGARKHQKVEDPRWLAWADRLGFLVWGEMANAYQYSPDYVPRIQAEWAEVLRRDHNHPCLVAWVPINESAGGRLTDDEPLRVDHLLSLYHLTRSLDPSRPVVSNDGWEHARTDLCTIHDYSTAAALARRYASRAAALAPAPSLRAPYHADHADSGEPILVSEFGGVFVGSPVEGIDYAVASDAADFLRRYEGLVDALLGSPVVRGFCYTQLTDVEQERNGLLTADRVPKLDPALVRAITTRPARVAPVTSHA